MERIETINLKTETDALEAGHGITYDELRGADMLANARKRLENEMRPRGIEPDGEQAVKDAETVRQAGLNAITPSRHHSSNCSRTTSPKRTASSPPTAWNSKRARHGCMKCTGPC